MKISENKEFIAYLEEGVGQREATIALQALEEPASISVRLNPYKLAESAVFSLETASPVFWNRHGLFLNERPVFTLDPVFHSGGYYVQDSSAMFVGHVFRKALERFCNLDRPIRVLDLCAAPGGKTTDISASLRETYGNSYMLVANEVMRQRVNVLSENVALWGDANVAVTCSDPKAFASLNGFFDIIVADVPCSGEGMFRKDEEAVNYWSVANVELCRARQRRIIADVWPALAEGGVLIYSTCTFNKYENDDNVSWISEELGADIIRIPTEFDGLVATKSGISLVPGLVRGEGQYCAALIKTAGTPTFRFGKHVFQAFRTDFDRLFKVGMRFKEKGGTVIAVPEDVVREVSALEALHPIMEGVAIGVVKGKDFVPDADLALSLDLDEGAFSRIEVSRDKALAFLHKDVISFPEAEKGIILLTYSGLPMGFVKNIGNRCNNLLPQSRKIRMNI